MATAARSFVRLASRSIPVTPTVQTTTTNYARPILLRQPLRASCHSYGGGPNTSSPRLNWGVWLVAVAGTAGCLYLSNERLTNRKKGMVGENIHSVTYKPGSGDYQKVYDTIAKLLVDKDEYDDGSYGPVLVRLAWHCSGTYDKDSKTGGSNGATMRFAPESGHGANAGLGAARDFLEPIKAKFPWITYSDLWTLAGVCAIQEMQGPVIPWRPGRTDADLSLCTPDGRLPDASKEQSHLRAIFGRMGFDDREIVALSGAHALGRCHADRSGYEGPWTFSPTVLSNDYYRLLLEEKWAYRKWNGPKQFEDVKTKSLMMLPTDMVLAKDKAFRRHVERYATDDKAFFDEFRDVFQKLLELGVPFQSGERISFKPSE